MPSWHRNEWLVDFKQLTTAWLIDLLGGGGGLLYVCQWLEVESQDLSFDPGDTIEGQSSLSGCCEWMKFANYVFLDKFKFQASLKSKWMLLEN